MGCRKERINKGESEMTREEQIRQAGIEYTIKNRPMCIGGGTFSKVVDEMNRNYAFEEGAKWADEHPKEGLVPIDRVCAYLEMRLDDYIIRDLRKAMEG